MCHKVSHCDIAKRCEDPRMDGYFVQSLTHFATQVPIYLVLLAGAGIAASRYRKHPQVSGLVMGACVTLVVTSIAMLVLNMILFQLMSSSGDYRTMGWVMKAFGGAHTLVDAVCYGLLIAAALSARPAADDGAGVRVPAA